MPETKRGPGRPKGSQTASYPTTVRVPPACPHCQCTERVVLSTVTRDLRGEHRGQDFNAVTHRKVRCDGCGRLRLEIEYRLIAHEPEQSSED